jgi:hypothetical protein
MTKDPNPNQIPMTNSQTPKKMSPTVIFIEIWSLELDWDLAPWSLVIPTSALRARR